MKTNKKLNIAFFGTPELTQTILDELEKNNWTPKLIVTGQDKPIGRKMTITPPPAKVWGLKHKVPVLQPQKLDPTFIEEFKQYDIDLSVVVAYGKIIPEALINMPQFGTLNIHYSLLPKFRGATPVEAAILAGEKETGVVIQKMHFKLDSGPVIEKEIIPIDSNEKAINLRLRLNEIGKKLLISGIKKIINNQAVLIEQDEAQVTFCKKIQKTDGEIQLVDDPELNYRKFKAYFGWPTTYFFMTHNEKKTRVIIKAAHLENGKFIVTRVTPEGKKEMAYDEFKKIAGDINPA